MFRLIFAVTISLFQVFAYADTTRNKAIEDFDKKYGMTLLGKVQTTAQQLTYDICDIDHDRDTFTVKCGNLDECYSKLDSYARNDIASVHGLKAEDLAVVSQCGAAFPKSWLKAGKLARSYADEIKGYIELRTEILTQKGL
jgi:hypothetical protein